MAEFIKRPGQRVLELGGGDNPSPEADVNVDVRPGPKVSFLQDFEKPLDGIGSEDFDGVLCRYCLEHLSFRAVPQFLKEVWRILKPGGAALFTTPNTQAQFQWLLAHREGWDGKDLFTAASEVLYGSQDYTENAHKVYLDPGVLQKLFLDAGFENVQTRAVGERETDLEVLALKPLPPPPPAAAKTEARLQQEEQDRMTGEGCPNPPPGGWRYDPAEALRKQGSSVEVAKNDLRMVLGHSPLPQFVGQTALVNHEEWLKLVRGEHHMPTVQEEMVDPDWMDKTDGRPLRDFTEAELLALGAPFTVAHSSCREAYEVHKKMGLHRPALSREELFDKHYFNGGGKVGGYAREGYWDYPVHEITFRKVMERKPKSVLEVGCARGYVLKRLQDAGVTAVGLEISRHCYLTRACDGIILGDLCQTPWRDSHTTLVNPQPFTNTAPDTNPGGRITDLCFSIATLEHVPEEHLPAVIREMARTCKRGLHGIDFGEKDDGFDKTHCTLKSKDWWEQTFRRHTPDWPVEIVDKEELERGHLPIEVIRGDGKLKLNIGSYTTMHHHGWTNVDVHDLTPFAQQHNYGFLCQDVRNGLPFGTSVVDLIMCNHMLEHLTYQEGLKFLKECRRVIRGSGAMRIVVPDAALLVDKYYNLNSAEGPSPLAEFDEINDDCAKCSTPAGKLYSLLVPGHQAFYDWETLSELLKEAGFTPLQAAFRKAHDKQPGSLGHERHEGVKQILRETVDMQPALSLFVDALPCTG